MQEELQNLAGSLQNEYANKLAAAQVRATPRPRLRPSLLALTTDLMTVESLRVQIEISRRAC